MLQLKEVTNNFDVGSEINEQILDISSETSKVFVFCILTEEVNNFGYHNLKAYFQSLYDYTR